MPLSSGEGGNKSRIQKVKKMVCDFRNKDNFKMAVYLHLLGFTVLSMNTCSQRFPPIPDGRLFS